MGCGCGVGGAVLPDTCGPEISLYKGTYYNFRNFAIHVSIGRILAPTPKMQSFVVFATHTYSLSKQRHEVLCPANCVDHSKHLETERDCWKKKME